MADFSLIFRERKMMKTTPNTHRNKRDTQLNVTTPSLDAMEELASFHGVALWDLILLGSSLLEASRGEKQHKSSLRRARRIVRLGIDSFKEQEKTVSFEVAYQEMLLAKAHRRKRTLSEIRYIVGRLLKRIPGLAKRPLRSMKSEEWQSYLSEHFQTPRQFCKSRLIIHGLFSFALKKGWVSSNPLSSLSTPFFQEKPVSVLSLAQIRTLLDCAKHEFNGACLPALGLMLYAGIRPHEVERLCWGDINFESDTISLSPQQTKTGGARKITLEPVLKRLLLSSCPLLEKENPVLESALPSSQNGLRVASRPIIPPNWRQKWKVVRQKAGFLPLPPRLSPFISLPEPSARSQGEFASSPCSAWQEWRGEGASFSALRFWSQDCLRHTFASYHALSYKNLPRLQYEMGHRSSKLLYTRYLNMQEINPTEAQAFFV